MNTVHVDRKDIAALLAGLPRCHVPTPGGLLTACGAPAMGRSAEDDGADGIDLLTCDEHRFGTFLEHDYAPALRRVQSQLVVNPDAPELLVQDDLAEGDELIEPETGTLGRAIALSNEEGQERSTDAETIILRGWKRKARAAATAEAPSLVDWTEGEFHHHTAIVEGVRLVIYAHTAHDITFTAWPTDREAGAEGTPMLASGRFTHPGATVEGVKALAEMAARQVRAAGPAKVATGR